jgi:hypothetical protein
MFYYFGRKGRIAGKYPHPVYPTVIEPFAGSAAYSLHYKPNDAVLIDRDEEVVALWHRLCDMDPAALAAADLPPDGEFTDDPWHVASLATKDGLSYGFTVRPWARQSFVWSRNIAVRHQSTARRFTYKAGNYWDAPDIEATWFIDPPYQQVSKGYRFGAGTIDYNELSEWCRTRKGQVIVCEQQGADWLPFQPFHNHTAVNNQPTREVWWTNQPTLF